MNSSESDHLSNRYVIHALPLWEQLHDTYRVLFFPITLAITAWVVWYFNWPSVVILGAGIGMLPSYHVGTPSQMAIERGDITIIDGWLAAHGHARDARGWVPRLPRIAYFDSQIVHYIDDAVIGPRLVLRKLQPVLRGRPPANWTR